MHTMAVANTQGATLAQPVPPRPGTAPTSFRDLLAALNDAAPQPGAGSRVVQAGDCLSSICAARLRAQGGALSPQALHAAVEQVAKANHIANPDLIFPGQRLALGALATTAGRPEGTALPGHPGPWQGLVEGTAALSSAFGLRKDPFTGRVRQHNGIDVAARAGTPIAACEAGSVTFSGWKAGYGQTVVIHHEDGLDSLYGHLARSLVKVGQAVAAHMPIANVGSNGRSTGPHLHFEVRRDGRALEPMAQLALLNAQ